MVVWYDDTSTGTWYVIYMTWCNPNPGVKERDAVWCLVCIVGISVCKIITTVRSNFMLMPYPWHGIWHCGIRVLVPAWHPRPGSWPSPPRLLNSPPQASACPASTTKWWVIINMDTHQDSTWRNMDTHQDNTWRPTFHVYDNPSSIVLIVDVLIIMAWPSLLSPFLVIVVVVAIHN